MTTLLIYDEEEGYARKLMEYLSEKRGIPFQVIAFDEEEALRKFVKENQAELMLISAKLVNIEEFALQQGQIIILSEGDVVSEYTEYPTIYKYQSADDIFREIMNCYAERNSNGANTPMFKNHQTQIIGVYSPVGRSGKTSFAMTLGQILATESSVLYLNMEEFSGFGKIFSKEYRNDLSDLMYFYHQSPDSVGVRLKALVENFHGMDYIPPMVYSEDLRNVKSEDWSRMIQDIVKTGVYDNIILDLSNMLSNVFGILHICDCIYMPLDNNRISLCKIGEYEEYLLRTDQEEILNKTVKVKLPGGAATDWNENHMEQLMWGEFGDFVRKIIHSEE